MVSPQRTCSLAHNLVVFSMNWFPVLMLLDHKLQELQGDRNFLFLIKVGFNYTHSG